MMIGDFILGFHLGMRYAIVGGLLLCVLVLWVMPKIEKRKEKRK